MKPRNEGVTKFQELLLGFIGRIDSTVNDEKIALDSKIRKCIDLNKEIYTVVAQATALGATPKEKYVASLLAKQLDTILMKSYANLEKKFGHEVKQQLSEAKELLKEPQRPKFK